MDAFELNPDMLNQREIENAALKSFFCGAEVRNDLPTCVCGRPAIVLRTKKGKYCVACKGWYDRDRKVIEDSRERNNHYLTKLMGSEDDAINEWRDGFVDKEEKINYEFYIIGDPKKNAYLGFESGSGHEASCTVADWLTAYRSDTFSEAKELLGRCKFWMEGMSEYNVRIIRVRVNSVFMMRA